MIKVGAEAEPTFKGPAVEEFLKTYCRTTHCGPEFEQARQKWLERKDVLSGASPTVSRPSRTAPRPTRTRARR